MSQLQANTEHKILIYQELGANVAWEELLSPYQIWQCASVERALEICEQESPACILIDWPYGKDLLLRLQTTQIPVVILVETESEEMEEILTLAQDYVVKTHLTPWRLKRTVANAIASYAIQIHSQNQLAAEIKANQELKQQLQMAQAVNLLSQSIHSTFDLSTIFTAATTAIGKLLNLDRVEVTKYHRDREVWTPLVEYRRHSDVPSALGVEIPDQDNQIAARLRQGETLCINSTSEVNCHVNQFLAQAYPGSWLIVPLVIETSIWGVISLDCHQRARLWQDHEIDLAQNIATQLGIAIRQSLFLHKLTTELRDRQAMEKALQDSERQLSILISNLPGYVYRVANDLNYTPQFISKGVFAVTGYHQREYLIDQTISCGQDMHPDDVDSVWQIVQTAILAHQPFECEYRIITKNGSQKWVWERGQGIYNELDELQFIEGFVTDISDRKSAESTLQSLVESTFAVTGRDFFAALVKFLASSLQVDHALISELVDGELQTHAFWSNQAQQANIRYNPQNSPCKLTLNSQIYWHLENIQQDFPDDHDLVRLGAQSYLGVALTNTLSQSIGVLCILDNQPMTDLNKRKAILQIFAARASAELEREHTTKALEQLNQQLEFKVQERTAALQASENRFRDFFEFAPIGIAVADVKTYQFVAVNDAFCQLLGYTKAELLEVASWLAISNVSEWDVELNRTEAMLRGEIDFYKIDKRYIKKNGELIVGELTATLIKDPMGNITHLVGMIRDITKERAAQLALHQQMQQQQLIMNITQQIRQSLNLDQVLETAVHEAERLLSCDRVIIFQLFPNVTKVVKEVVRPEYPSILERAWLDEHFSEEGLDYYINAQPRIVDNVDQDIWADCLAEFMVQAQIKSKIVAPIVQHIQLANQLANQSANQSANQPNDRWQKGHSQLWGLLIVHSCQDYRQWQPEEAKLLQQLANQLAIAIQQASLYERIANELATRQQLELELGRQAAADRLLSEITISINQSSHLEQILDQTLEKVRKFLASDRVLIFQLEPDDHGKVVKEATSSPDLSILDQVISDSCFTTTDLKEQYLQGKVTILQDLENTAMSSCYADLLRHFAIKANIAAPIIHSNQLWGLLLVHQCHSPRVWLPMEINLIKQVATQIGISAHKEKLYLDLSSELNQKKVLLKEIHHRVKNNLQVMSSLLRMQFRNTAPEIQVLADEYQNRIQSMALIHDQLYHSTDISHIDFYDYLTSLTANLFQCYGSDRQLIKLNLEVDQIFAFVSLDQSIPLGLIINELVSNALKYAFPKGFGQLNIKLGQLGEKLCLTVSDNGVGIPKDLDIQNTHSLGMQLVYNLTEQLDGEMVYDGSQGSSFEITFPFLP